MVAIKENLGKITHEIRQQIIVELGEKVAMSYSDLMKGLNLTSAKLHFHLKKLSGLVEQNNEGTYTLTERGKEAYNFIAGTETAANFGTTASKSRWAAAWPLIIVLGFLPVWLYLRGVTLGYGQDMPIALFLDPIWIGAFLLSVIYFRWQIKRWFF